jgi:hypothetical protein
MAELFQRRFFAHAQVKKGSSEIFIGNRIGKKRKGNFRNMRISMEGDNDGWAKYNSKNNRTLLLI